MQVGVAISHSSRPNFCCCPIFVNIPGKFETHSNKIRHPQLPNPNFCCCTALIDKSEDSTFRRVFRLFQNFYIQDSHHLSLPLPLPLPLTLPFSLFLLFFNLVFSASFSHPILFPFFSSFPQPFLYCLYNSSFLKS